jgi:hypothetical protein
MASIVAGQKSVPSFRGWFLSIHPGPKDSQVPSPQGPERRHRMEADADHESLNIAS